MNIKYRQGDTWQNILDFFYHLSWGGGVNA